MKLTIIAALICTPLVAFANGTKPVPGTVPPTKVVNINKPSNTINNIPTSVSTSDQTQSVTTSANGTASASSAGGVATNSMTVQESRLAVAPDVISYPTAPCRISIGASGGWFGGAIGFSGSSLDEACSRIETSRHLHNLGAKTAAVQIMCLSDEARQALEATGVKCLIKAEAPQEAVKP